MTSRILAGEYDLYEDAQNTAKDLEAAKVPFEDISILTNNSDGRAGIIDTPPGGETGAKIGAVTGTVLGAGAGLLAGISLLAIPAIGPVAAAGWLVTTLVGAGAGAGLGSATGGLIGSLTQAGLTTEEAHYYAEAVRRGGTVLLVKASDDRVPVVSAILQRHNSVDRTERERHYRADGWIEFDETARAYTPVRPVHEMHNPYRGPQL